MMNKKFKESILFILIFYVIAVFVDSVLTEGIRRQTGCEMGVWQDIVKGDIKADILISGDSRALTGINCEQLESYLGMSCYNIALNGNGIDLQLARLKLFLKYNRKPKIIVQTLGRATLRKSSEIVDAAQFFPYIKEDILYKELVALNPEYKMIKYIPLYGYAKLKFDTNINSLKGYFGINAPNCFDRVKGFLPFPSNWNDDFDNFKKNHPNGRDANLERAGVFKLFSLIDLCKKNKIELVFVYTPEFYEAQSYMSNRVDFFSLIKKIAATNNIDFFDYSGHKISRDRKNFYNSQHLNYYGSKIFASVLWKDFSGILNKYQGR